MDGAIAVAETAQRSVMRVDGQLASVRSKRVGPAASLVAELDDGSGVIRLVWFGRQRISGIEPGRAVTVEGVPTIHRGRKTIFNPRYQLAAIPAQAGPRE
jgi:RecG wedge domain